MNETTRCGRTIEFLIRAKRDQDRKCLWIVVSKFCMDAGFLDLLKSDSTSGHTTQADALLEIQRMETGIEFFLHVVAMEEKSWWSS